MKYKILTIVIFLSFAGMKCEKYLSQEECVKSCKFFCRPLNGVWLCPKDEDFSTICKSSCQCDDVCISSNSQCKKCVNECKKCINSN